MSDTPILDLAFDPPPAPSRWRACLIGMAIGVIVVIGTMLYQRLVGSSLQMPGFNGLLILPGFYVAIALHEIGHLAAAKLARIDTGGIAVGGFAIVKSGPRWCATFRWRRMTGGFFKPLITHPDTAIRDLTATVAGGPLASLVSAILCSALWYGVGDTAYGAFGSLFWLNLFVFLLSMVPYSSGLTRTDGARLWQLANDPASARAWIALLRIQTEDANGIRPRDWNSDVFAEASMTKREAPEYAYVQLLAYCRALDSSRADVDALGYLETALATSQRSGQRFRATVFLEAASVSALMRCRPEQARTWCARAIKVAKPVSRAHFDAALSFAEGHYGQALDHWRLAREWIAGQNLGSGLARFALDQYAHYERLCAERTVPQAETSLNRVT